jgi:octaprenyl-diphosphate synthase
MPIKTIRDLLQQELAATDAFIMQQLHSEIPLVRQIVAYILECGGKRIRPMVLLAAAKAANYDNAAVISLAAVIELIHTATLLHDDVVDHASFRRGQKTANTIWSNEASVLIGDFLYSRAFQIVVELDNKLVLDIFAKSTHYMAEGEILQLVHAHNPDTTEELYFTIIKRKTAKLFEIAAGLGVALGIDLGGGITMSTLKSLSNYGFNLGIAYQLIDDVIDYSGNLADAGKNIGNDLAEGKATLPLIYAVGHSAKKDVALLRDAFRQGNSSDLVQIASIIAATGGLEYTAHTAKQYAQAASANLVILPPSPYRQALYDLADSVVKQVIV